MIDGVSPDSDEALHSISDRQDEREGDMWGGTSTYSYIRPFVHTREVETSEDYT